LQLEFKYRKLQERIQKTFIREATKTCTKLAGKSHCETYSIKLSVTQLHLSTGELLLFPPPPSTCYGDKQPLFFLSVKFLGSPNSHKLSG